MIYAGIGSRSTPGPVLSRMTVLARLLAERGNTLRSGGADGADTAFEIGCDQGGGSKEIFLPWRGFNGHGSQLYTQSPMAFEIAALYHPAWDNLKDPVRKLMARNVHQVLGWGNCDNPVDFVVCWTSDGVASGGTGQAMRIAEANKIPVFNFYYDDMVHNLREFYRRAHG